MWGIWVVGALHVLPIWLYALANATDPAIAALLAALPAAAVPVITAILWGGRLLSASIELWVISTHSRVLLARRD